MNPKYSAFNHKFYQWGLIAPFVHMVGIILVWKSPQNVIYWSILSLILYGVLTNLIIKSIHQLPWIIGYANWVSLGRLCTIHLLFILHQFLTDHILLVGFLVVILLDGVDGYLARKYNHETREGAVLDNETDALMALFLTWIHVSNQRIPDWILIPGGLRYFYVWIIHILPVSNKKELLPRKVRATIGVTFFISLLLPFAFQIPEVKIITSITGALIVLSFLSGLSLRVYTASKKE